MKYGFKADAEKQSERLRKELGIPFDQALPAKQLAEHMQVVVLGIEDIPNLDPFHVEYLLKHERSDWSGYTMEVEARKFVVHNTLHSQARQESNIMHELAHILCGHSPGEIVWFGALCMRYYDPAYEEEATWLGGALQIPRKALLRLASQGYTVEDIAKRFGASKKMVQFRLHAGGVMTQLKRAQKYIPR